jgi:hypothetical protein
MSYPLATIFYGDVTIQQGSDTSHFGFGDLFVHRNAIISGTMNSTAPENGSLTVLGGLGVTKTIYVGENLNVLQGITNLTETHIDTNTSRTTITGGNGLLVNVIGDTEIVTSGASSGTLLLQSTNDKVKMYSGNNNTGSTPAIHIQATHVNGNINLEGGSQSGNITVSTGSGGLTMGSTNGNVQIQANNSEMSIRSDQNMNILKRGSTDTKINIDSFGTNEAINITTRDPNGKIIIANAFNEFNTKGQGSGSIEFLTGSNGFFVTTNTGGSIELLSHAGSGLFQVNSNNSNQNLQFILNGETNSQILLRSYGTNDAIQVETLSTTGNIKLIQPINSNGGFYLNSGQGGTHLTTATGGTTQIITNGAESLIQNKTTTDGQHLRINTVGGTNSKVIIETDNSNANAITINASSGSVYIHGGNSVSLQSNTQIELGTNNDTNVPVKIGTNTSTTTINGNLIVQGTTTTVNSESMTVKDNIIIINNGPTVTADGGFAIHRFQYSNDNSEGDVVSDDPEEESIVVGLSSNSLTTINLSGALSSVNDYYKDYWLKIVSGTGISQVRKIKSYNGSTKIAEIYSTADRGENEILPYIIGLDFITIPDSTSRCNLYPCEYVLNIWDESEKEFAYVCSTSVSTSGTTIAHYADLHVNDFIANDIYVNTVNGSSADKGITLELNNNSTAPINISEFPSISGVYTVMVSPEDPTLTTAHAIFMIGRSILNVTGSIVRIISVKGANDEQLDMIWPANQVPQIFYRQSPNTGGNTRFKLKIIGI